MRRLALLLGAALAAACLLAGPALADGDPASDYLLGQQQFVPPDLGVSSASAARLAGTLAQARAKGYPIRVALIGSRYDLGSVTALWKHPKVYARFLGEELRLVYHKRLLVVMPNGYGTSLNGVATPAQQAVVDRLPLPAGNADLANAAVRAVVALAAHSGIALTPSAAGATAPTSSAGSDRLIIGVVTAAVVLLGAAAWWGRRRLRARSAG